MNKPLMDARIAFAARCGERNPAPSPSEAQDIAREVAEECGLDARDAEALRHAAERSVTTLRSPRRAQGGPSPLQKEVASKVVMSWRSSKYYRAARSGERVTLASLFRAGVLARRCWRGVDGESNAAYEYRPSNDLLLEIARAGGQSEAAALMPVATAMVAFATTPEHERTITAMVAWDKRHMSVAPEASHAVAQWLKNSKASVRDCDDDAEPYGRDVISAVRELGEARVAEIYARLWLS